MVKNGPDGDHLFLNKMGMKDRDSHRCNDPHGNETKQISTFLFFYQHSLEVETVFGQKKSKASEVGAFVSCPVHVPQLDI